MCLVCREQIALFKDYRLNPLCETKQGEKYKKLTKSWTVASKSAKSNRTFH